MRVQPIIRKELKGTKLTKLKGLCETEDELHV